MAVISEMCATLLIIQNSVCVHTVPELLIKTKTLLLPYAQRTQLLEFRYA